MIITQNGVNFALNQYDFTAQIVKSLDASGEIMIPYSIRKDDKDYIITSINEQSFSSNRNITMIKFPKDSEIHSIGEKAFFKSSLINIFIPDKVKEIKEKTFSFCDNLETITLSSNSELVTIQDSAFSYSSIEKLYIPPKVIDLHRGWCNKTPHLIRITISPKNPRYFYLDDKIIIGKSEINLENFDLLVFARRDINEIQVPSFITRILSFSFFECKNLSTVKFTEDSQLNVIEEESFEYSSLQSFVVPRGVEMIGKNSFTCCNELKSFQFYEDSKLTFIQSDIFSSSRIRSLYIPANITILEDGWCKAISRLVDVKVSPKNRFFKYYKNQILIGRYSEYCEDYDLLIFARRDIRELIIPSFINHICSFSLAECHLLKNVIFESNLNVEVIGQNAFSYSGIESISIPESVKYIEDKAFACCEFLHTIELLNDCYVNEFMFVGCYDLFLASFPNANQVTIEIIDLPENFSLFIKVNGKVFTYEEDY